jgi:tetratricopeptide (TPR) repeat protein
MGQEQMATECALLVAENILDDCSRDDALERIAQIWASAGLIDQAMNAVEKIRDPQHRIWSLAQTALHGTFPKEMAMETKKGIFNDALFKAAGLPEPFSRGWIINKINLAANRADIHWEPSRWFAASAATACQVRDASAKCTLMAEIIGGIAETWACPQAWDTLGICLDAAESDIQNEEKAGLIAGAAGAYHASGNQAYGRELFFKALAITENIQNPTDLVWVTGCVAEIFHQNGDVSLAREVMNYGCGLIDSNNDTAETAWLMGAYGSLYCDIANYELAVKMFEKAFKKASLIEDPYAQGNVMVRITDFYVNSGLADKALDLPETIAFSKKIAETLYLNNEDSGIDAGTTEIREMTEATTIQSNKVVALAHMACDARLNQKSQPRRGEAISRKSSGTAEVTDAMERILTVLAG